jgi:hypothetical protein
VGVKDLEVMEVEEWNDIEQVYWYLKKNPGKFKTVIIDTMSQLQQIAIEHVLESKGKDKDSGAEWGVMTQREWGDVASMLKPLITNLRDLPMDVVFIAQHRVFNMPVEEEEEGHTMLAPEVGPQLMPSVAKHLNASVSIIGNTFIRSRVEEVVTKKGKGARAKEVTEEVEHIEYCLRIGPNPVYTTKVRKAKAITIPDVIEDPDFDKIMKALKGE